ncbi:MAG: hypothetical protein IK990_18470 [Ruminiclostridium sp.]|nr:hypothetical protein [Ruminiclostridium sp.]
MAENEIVPEDQDSERFNSMLNAAQKQVGAKGGAKPADGKSGASLTQAQIEAMLAGESFDDDNTAAAEKNDPGAAAETQTGRSAGGSEGAEESDDDAAIADRFRNSISADSQAAAEETEKKTKKTKEKKEKKPKEKKEKKPLDPGTLAKILTAAAVVIACALGFLVNLLFFTDAIKTPNQEFSIRAANAVIKNLAPGTDIYVYKAYVRNGVSSDECMIYAVTDSERISGSEKTEMYRVVVNHDQPNRVNVYYTLDTESPEYLKMLDSGDETMQKKAIQLKNYSDAIYSCDKEIQISSPTWEKINSNTINKALKQEKESVSEKQ